MSDHVQAPASPRPNRLRAVSVSKTNRSAMANGSTILGGVDGRTAEARRFRDIVINLAEDLGGLAGLPEHDAALIRHAAALTMQSEGMQRTAVRGEAVDTEQLVRITNALTRTLNAVHTRRKPKRAPTLAERLAEVR